MGDKENALPSKKRAAGRELSWDNPGLDDGEDTAPEQETGTFQKASEEVLASRRIVKVCRNPPPTAASSNPFAGIRLVPSTGSGSKTSTATIQAQPVRDEAVSEEVDSKGKIDEDKETEKGAAVVGEQNGRDENGKQLRNETNGPVAEAANDERNDSEKVAVELEKGDKKTETKGDEAEKKVKEENGQEKTAAVAAPLSLFQRLSNSQNAFTGLAGTGFSSSSFSFGSVPKDGPAPLSGLTNGSPSFSSLGTANSNNGSPSSLQLFGAVASDATKSEGSSRPSMQQVVMETGEEKENAVFTADAALFEYVEGGWKERGKGELKVNVSTQGTERARLVMRAKGNYRLILNAGLYPDMKLTNMDKRGITFMCMNSAVEGKDSLTTFALKFKDGATVNEFCGAITAHKGKRADALNMPENSPKDF
ncbi:nuclear pore complex protein NUP50A-like [Magnolia sinica]|uniref:nuclear pore complex protein NUP50A-like n=1 Tax=Magnolia sinica TaxID=86752 RepID=UPI00265963D3|nr:nuclear pore complex protein NUP50A-like [Magnolia sinica]XP_058111436.1 nuclear pore complex protein NUP50A-like [Magnolia sinica]